MASSTYRLIPASEIPLTPWYKEDLKRKKSQTLSLVPRQVTPKRKQVRFQITPEQIQSTRASLAHIDLDIQEKERDHRQLTVVLKLVFEDKTAKDPVVSAMISSNMLWGDIVYNYEQEHPEEVIARQQKEKKPETEEKTHSSSSVSSNANPSLRLGNLPATITRQDLEWEFVPFGAIKDIHIPLDRTTKKPRGFGFIEFKNASDAKKAIDALRGNLVISDRPIKIEFAIATRKSSEEMAKRS
jgi:hypothetical protein